MRRALIVLALLGGTACSSGDRSLSGEEQAKLLVDRNWLDVWPTDKDHRIHVYRFTPGMGGGVFQDRTVFRGEFELFTFGLREDRLELVFPDSGERVATRFHIDKVDGPMPFDLRLTFDHSPRGPRVYYGRTAETAGADLDAELAREH